jgi:hypothetical protein
MSRYGLRTRSGQIAPIIQTINGLAQKITAIYGYFAGGFTGASVAVATGDRITFSTSTTAAQTSANLSQARWGVGTVSDKTTYGYFAGGTTSAGVATADRITFSTSTTAAQTSANLSQARWGVAGLSDGNTYGYFAGGFTGSSVAVATGDRITFSTSTTAAQTSANLSQARYYLSGLSDNSTYGYFAGGITGSSAATSVTTADRITFSTSTTAAQTSANLSQARYVVSSVSDNITYGYFAGGFTGAAVATAELITFSTSTTAAQTSANLSTVRYGMGGSSDGQTYGYFAGGDSGTIVGTSDRITFSTSTTAAQTSANLSQARNAVMGLSDYAI